MLTLGKNATNGIHPKSEYSVELAKFLRRYNTMDVAVYCRVSSDEQAERGTIDNQRVYADKYGEPLPLKIIS